MSEDKWKKLTPIEGGPGGCLHCGYQHEILPLGNIIAVGFGDAGITKNGKHVWSEQESNGDFDKCLTVQAAEDMALKDPDNDWRIYYYAPLSERHYQRQGDNHWVLYERGQGFA